MGRAELEGTGARGATSLEGAKVEKVSAGGPGFAGVGLQYFKGAPEERSICDHWVLNYINGKTC